MSLLALWSLGLAAHAASWQVPVQPAPTASLEARAAAVLPPHIALAAPSVHQVAGGRTVRFQQTHLGLEVLGAQAAVRVRADGTLSRVHSSLADQLGVLPVAEVPAEVARQRAADPGETAHDARLAVLPEGEGRLVWVVRVGSATDLEQVLVDARSGEVVHRRSLRSHALGRVYAENAVSTPTPVDLELIALDAGSPLTGFDGLLRVEQYVSGTVGSSPLVTEQTLGPNDGDDYLYDPPTDPLDPADAFAQVNAWYHMSHARNYFSALTGEAMTDASWGLQVVVNGQQSGAPLDNAFFTPAAGLGLDLANLVFIGQGTRVDFAVDADVFVHELGHYVSTNAIGYNAGQLHTTGLGLSPWGGAIDEGISDYFAASHFDDPEIGEASLGSFGADRDLATDIRTCPDDITGEVHEDGILIGATGWALREAYGAEVADALVWGALTLMTSDSDLYDFSLALEAVGEDMLAAGELGDLTDLRTTLGRFAYEDCAGIQDVSERPRRSVVWGLDLMGSLLGLDCAGVAGFVSTQSFFHFEMPTDADADGLAFDVEVDAERDGDLSWTLYVREDAPVGFQTRTFLPEPVDFDFTSATFTDASATIELDPSEYTPGSTLYAVVMSQSCPNTLVSVSGRDLVDDPGGDDSGGSGDGGSGDGTDGETDGETDGGTSSGSGEAGDDKGGCSTVGTHGTGWGGAALLGLVAFVRRRRDATSDT